MQHGKVAALREDGGARRPDDGGVIIADGQGALRGLGRCRSQKSDGGEERAPVTWAAALPGAPGRLTRLGDILGSDFRASAIEVRAERDGVSLNTAWWD